ncbi:putative mannitol dehydrogenase [Dendrobium catenatum]|uniref:Putative mannitol dehydrogenase n=1 Tax=Dendrobium catenatum TaxID=906689 RepID=A0A2I0WRJ1_9ASPA|nr:putative mannitol dehydrogenase [Dendrobium catenatum]
MRSPKDIDSHKRSSVGGIYSKVCIEFKKKFRAKVDRPGRLGGSSRTMLNNGSYQPNVKCFKSCAMCIVQDEQWIGQDDYPKMDRFKDRTENGISSRMGRLGLSQHEIAGIVIEAGCNVLKLKIGDTVGVGCLVGACRSCEKCVQHKENYCPKLVFAYNSIDIDGKITYGGYSNIIVVDEHFVVKFPKNFPIDRGAPLLCAGITVYSPMKNFELDQPGKHIGVVVEVTIRKEPGLVNPNSNVKEAEGIKVSTEGGFIELFQGVTEVYPSVPARSSVHTIRLKSGTSSRLGRLAKRRGREREREGGTCEGEFVRGIHKGCSKQGSKASSPVFIHRPWGFKGSKLQQLVEVLCLLQEEEKGVGFSACFRRKQKELDSLPASGGRKRSWVLCQLQEEAKGVGLSASSGWQKGVFMRASPPCCGSKRRVT